MKKLNQKQWGILGTSLGSVLIIVALLTMVGIGSNDTYAATTTSCTCPSGYTHVPNTANCIKSTTESYSCCSGLSCKEHTGVDYCSSTEGCSLTSTKEVGLGSTAHTVSVYSCSKKTTTDAACTCPDGTTSNGSGQCVGSSSSSSSSKPSSGSGSDTTTCSPGQYYAGLGVCATCPSGSYCPGGNFATSSSNRSGGVKCPDNKPYSDAGSSSVSDCKTSSGSLSCPSGEYRAAGDCVTCPQGSYCPGGDDSTKHDCPIDKPKSNAGSSSINDCKAGDSGENRITCLAGTYYTGATKKCETCLPGSYCPGTSLPANTTLQGTDGIFKCPTDKPYSTAGAKKESDCVASGSGGSGGGNPSNPSSGGSGGSGDNPSSPSSDGGTGGNGSGNSSNTNTNPSTATKAPLVIVIVGIIAMGLGTFTYYKSKNNEM